MSHGRHETRSSGVDRAARSADSTTEELEDDELEAHGAPTARKLEVSDSYLSKIPKILLSPQEVNAADLDHREYFLLSLLDGMTSIENLLDICGMPSEEALALFDGLVRRGIVGLPH
jgi:hypothetical protein